MKKETMQGKVIRCRKCNNVIAVKTGNIVKVTKHGREIKIELVEKQVVDIVCERCNQTNEVRCGE